MKFRASHAVLIVAVLLCALQLFWFGLKCLHQIDYDGMAYTGIARHLRHGQFFLAINAFRSPLLSWMIAGIPSAGSLVSAGKFINVSAFLASVALLYLFTNSLWHSRMAASISVLLYVLGRGLCLLAVAMITPDFLLAAFALGYFIVLLRCLRESSGWNWTFLGVVHSLAYLAKSFALPWLAVCTIVAAALSPVHWRQKVKRIVFAALAPIVMAAAWGSVLYSKYGVFTLGSQFKTNFLQWTLRAFDERHDETYEVLTDTTRNVDEYLVDDPMPPHSWPWTYRVSLREHWPQIVAAERQNVPKALKEIVIVVTPGIVLAWICAMGILARRRREYDIQFRVALVIASAGMSLVLAYSMLVFDMRYLFPLTPLLLAVGSGLLVCEVGLHHSVWRRTSVVLALAGVVISFIYASSPFRRITRDFQAICYVSGQRLRSHPGSMLVSIGSGPFPEVGVGWEAGYKTAYFGDWRIVGSIERLTTSEETAGLLSDLKKASPDAIIVWGLPSDVHYVDEVGTIRGQYRNGSKETIVDPVLGEVGSILFKADDQTPRQ